MSVNSMMSSDGRSMTIRVTGRFDFSKHSEFRSAYEGERPGQYVVDMHRVEYMDSSALGMLLMLREHAGGDSADIRIENCAQDVKAILKIASFEKLFHIADCAT